MFRRLGEEIGYGDGRTVARADQYDYATTFLASERRMLFLRGVIVGWPGGFAQGRDDQFSPTAIMDSIIAMNVEDSARPITLVINSVGGVTDEGMMLYDVIKLSRAPIVTLGMNCASMATVLLAAGGTRLAMPHSRFMLHLPSASGMSGDVKELELHTKEINKTKDTLVGCYIECGVTAKLQKADPKKIRKQILSDIDRVFWIGAEQAIKYGLVDRIVIPSELFGA